MRILAAFFLSAGLLVSCAAHSLDDATRRMLETTEGVQTSRDLAELLEASLGALDEKELWLDAVAMAKHVMEDRDVDRTAVIRLMEAALLEQGVEADNEPISDVSPADIASMREALGFPGECDVLLYLLKRGPSVNEHGPSGEYVVIRLAPPGGLVRVIEWTSQPFLGIGPDGHTRTFRAEDDPVCSSAGEYAKTQRLNLGALPDLILAAKAYRAAARAGQEFAAYPLLVAAQAVNAAFVRNPKIGFSAFSIFCGNESVERTQEASRG